jgi:hypothetical protein
MLPFATVKIPFDSKIVEPEIALRSTFRQPKWHKLTWSINDNRVKVWHQIPSLLNNSWNPIFEGRLAVKGDERTLVGSFRCSWLVLALTALLPLWVLAKVVMILLEPTVREGYALGWKGAEVADNLLFLPIFLAVVGVGWLLGLPYQRRILKALQDSAAGT